MTAASAHIAIAVCSVDGSTILGGLPLALGDKVSELKKKVQDSVLVRHVTLITADGKQLTEHHSIQDLGLADGDSLTATFGRHDVLYLIPHGPGCLVRYDITEGNVSGIDCPGAKPPIGYQCEERFAGSALFRDKVYLMPRDAEIMLIYNTREDKMDVVDVPFAREHSRSKWRSPIVANGKLYGIPSNANSILVYDLMVGVMWDVDVSHVEACWFKWDCAVLDGDEIIAIPSSADAIMIYNVVSGEVSGVDVTSLGVGLSKWGHAVKYDRKVYAIPLCCNNMLVYDCVTRAVYGVDFSVVVQDDPMCQYVIEVDGKLYILPCDGDTMFVYDTATMTLSGVDLLPLGEGDWIKLVAVDGVLYGAPNDHHAILKYDTRTGILSCVDLSKFARAGGPIGCSDVVVIEDKLYLVSSALKCIIVYDIYSGSLKSINASHLSSSAPCISWGGGIHVVEF